MGEYIFTTVMCKLVTSNLLKVSAPMDIAHAVMDLVVEISRNSKALEPINDPNMFEQIHGVYVGN